MPEQNKPQDRRVARLTALECHPCALLQSIITDFGPHVCSICVQFS